MSADLLTTQQASEILQTPAPTLVRWRFERRGPAYVKLGASVRYKRADLEAWITANRVDPQTEATS